MDKLHMASYDTPNTKILRYHLNQEGLLFSTQVYFIVVHGDKNNISVIFEDK